MTDSLEFDSTAVYCWVTTWMGDRLRAGKPSRNVTGHPGQLSLAVPPWIGALNSSLRAAGQMPSVADWGVICLHAAPRVQSFASADNGWPHNALNDVSLAHANQLPLPRL